MTTEAEPRTTFEIGGMGHSVKRKEDPRFIRGQGEYIDDVNLPGQLWLDIVRSPYAHATIKCDRRLRGAEDPGRRRRRHRQGSRGLQAPLDADAGRRHADGAPDRHGHVPVAGGRRGHRDLPYAAADGVAAVLVDYEPLPVIIDPYKALEPDAFVLRPDRGPDKAEQPHLALGVRRRGGDRRRPGRGRGPRRARTSTSRASTSPRSRRAAASPTGTRSASSSRST